MSKPGKSGAPASAQVLIRTDETTRDRWKQAAATSGKTLSDFVRDLVTAAADEIIDCPHPEAFRRRNLRAEYCTKCGKKLR